MTQLRQMKGQRGRGDAEALGDPAGRQAAGAGLHQQAEHVEPIVLGERGQGRDDVSPYLITIEMEHRQSLSHISKLPEIPLTSAIAPLILTVMKLDDAAARLEALGNPTRLKIYRTLVRAGAEGMPVGRLQEPARRRRLDPLASSEGPDRRRPGDPDARGHAR